MSLAGDTDIVSDENLPPARSNFGTPSSSPPTPPSPLPVSIGPGNRKYPFSPSPTPSPPFSPEHSSPETSPLPLLRRSPRPRPQEPSVFSLDKPVDADPCPPAKWWRRKIWLKWLLRICLCCCSSFLWEYRSSTPKLKPANPRNIDSKQLS